MCLTLTTTLIPAAEVTHRSMWATRTNRLKTKPYNLSKVIFLLTLTSNKSGSGLHILTQRVTRCHVTNSKMVKRGRREGREEGEGGGGGRGG